jgi:hypothetical protein
LIKTGTPQQACAQTEKLQSRRLTAVALGLDQAILEESDDRGQLHYFATSAYPAAPNTHYFAGGNL